MKLSFAAAAATLAVVVGVVSSQDTRPTNVGYKTIQIHGSGTTNPSKCYWNIMDELQYAASLPVRLTYRSTGSTTGIAEFKQSFQVTSGFHEYPVFASGDFPLSTADFLEINQLANADSTTRGNFVQLPVVAGAVGFFYNLPGMEDLKLDPCTLAKIFTLEIVTWNHPDIVANNPQLENNGLPIRVVVRDAGSSSTNSITNYLLATCPEFFPANLATDKEDQWQTTWSTGKAHETAHGSGGMSDKIFASAGSIGYIDSGHAHALDLQEVALQNFDKTAWLTSKQVGTNGVAAAITKEGNFPESADQDFKGVLFVNKSGNGNSNTWPIVLISYIYVKKDVTAVLPDEIERSFLIAFLKSLFDPDYVTVCRDEYEFTLLPDDILQFAREGIALIAQSSNITKEWYFEKDSEPLLGSAELVISSRRNDLAADERHELEQGLMAMQIEFYNSLDMIDELSESIEQMEDMIQQLQASMGAATAGAGAAGNTGTATNNAAAEEAAMRMNENNFGDQEQTQLKAALILSCFSFVFWMLYGLAWIKFWVTGK